MYKFVFSLLLFWVTLFSCHSVNNKKEITTLNTIQEQVDSLLNIVENMRKDSLDFFYHTTKEKLSFFKQANTLLPNTQHQLIVSEWSYLFKFFKKNKSKPVALFYQLNFSKKQINNLKTDIKNNAWTEKEISDFVNDEKQVLKKTENEINYLNQSFTNKKAKFYVLLPKINTIIDSIRLQQNK